MHKQCSKSKKMSQENLFYFFLRFTFFEAFVILVLAFLLEEDFFAGLWANILVVLSVGRLRADGTGEIRNPSSVVGRSFKSRSYCTSSQSPQMSSSTRPLTS